MKQASRIQQQMERVQQELASKTVEGVAGGGTVRVTARCDQTLAAIKIAPEALNPADVAFLEELIVTAANQALVAAKEISQKEMNAVTQGISIPGLM